jgi:hypothetical protein
MSLPLALAFARLWPLSPDQLIRSGISSLTQGNSHLLSTNNQRALYTQGLRRVIIIPIIVSINSVAQDSE